MKSNFLQKQTSRRDILRGSVTLAGSAFLAHLFPATLLHASAAGYAQQSPSPADLLADMRAKFNAAPLKTQSLAENVTMLSGPGGSVVVLNGPDGKFVVDTFVAPAWPRLEEALDSLGNAPVQYVIDTHWHFDHTDNNAHLHAAGATVLAHENTKKRMSEPHDLPVLYRGPDGALAGLHFDPSPAEALPQQTFAASYKLQANGETLALQHVAPAHTDSDIYVHFQKANVIQMGDLFFNGMYPYIDPGTGGKITGMIAGAEKILSLAGNDTRIVAGHGPLGNKADVTAVKRILALQDGPSILVAHSYGGAVITQAGTDPSVAGLVYVAAHMPDAGEKESDDGKRFPSDLAKSGTIKKTADGFTYIAPERFHELFAADLPSDQAAFMARSQVFNFADNFSATITTAAWRTKPSWMLVAGSDRTINPGLERWYAKRAGSHTVEVAGASHSVYVSHPKEVADVIESAARAVSK